ncbi:WD40 repeat-like protein [Sanghuangporus baumii]|uniref:WD40 repeat-like protein n=1 Tax=Sanghuangporus baumii TaxID=108892 RepID=A0A9Q5HQL5_SANBA|nr:WD40 repeat-like protein [Sanghuangporus baumii]
MGIIKVWEIERSYGDSPNCRATQKEELIAHRTGINDMWFGQGQLWTASSDDTVLLTQRPPSGTVQQTPSKPVPPISHPTAVKALLPLSLTDLGESLLLTGASDAIRLFDINEPSSPELLSTTDAHWFDIVSLRLWFRRRTTEDGKLSVEPWIVSASLDQTIRRWKLADLISPPKEPPKPVPKQEEKPASASQLTAEEEAELAELMDDD